MAFSDTSYLSCQPEQPQPLQGEKESQFRYFFDNRNDAIFQLEVVSSSIDCTTPTHWQHLPKQHQVLPSRAVQKQHIIFMSFNDVSKTYREITPIFN